MKREEAVGCKISTASFCNVFSGILYKYPLNYPTPRSGSLIQPNVERSDALGNMSNPDRRSEGVI